MSDEPTALTASPASPSDAEYEAISQTFLQTARGRWFLGEYLRRNRNADTRLVLDAMARIEANIAARAAQAEAEGASAGETLAGESIPSLRAMIAAQRNAITAHFSQESEDGARIAVQRGIRIIREVSWSMREYGNDPRISDILDGQLAAIERAQDAFPRAAQVVAQFDTMLTDIDAHVAAYGLRADASDPVDDATDDADDDILVEIVDDTTDPVTQAAADDAAAADDLDDIDFDDLDFAAADEAAQDALLERVAAEMALSDAPEMPPPAIAIAAVEPGDRPVLLPNVPRFGPLHDSLGAALLAHGLIEPQDDPTPNDPLAPLRKMTQAERVAFFS